MISLILFSIVFYTRYTSTKESLITSRMRKLELMHNEIEFTLKDIISDLVILSGMVSFKEFMNSGSVKSMNEVEHFFNLFCAQRKVYDQVRFIDQNGMEVIRINYNKGSSSIVPKENLQYKGNRYYFQEIFLLKDGQVFFSPLDLNIEEGVVEKPLKPMVRVGIPVFDIYGKRKGILLLNYFGQNIIDIVSGHKDDNEGSFLLLNPDSYWLYSPNPEKSWAFMYPNRHDQNFSNTNPEIWKDMTLSDKGLLKNSNSTYIFHTVSPVNNNIYAPTDRSYINGGASSPDNDGYYWKIVSHIPDTVFYSIVKNIALQMLTLVLSVITVALIISIILAKLLYIQIKTEQQTQKSLEEKELLLKEIHHRVKNSLSLVSSYIGLYSSSLENEKDNLVFDELRQKIDTISLVHTHLYQSPDIKHISLIAYFNTLLKKIMEDLSVRSSMISFRMDMEDVKLVAKTTVTLGLIISELALNSLKHAFNGVNEGFISIKGYKEGSQMVLIYSDSGKGLPSDFNIEDSDSLGIVLITSLVDQLGGVLIITTGINSNFTIKFPVLVI